MGETFDLVQAFSGGSVGGKCKQLVRQAARNPQSLEIIADKPPSPFAHDRLG
jgi:hypothetical protein